MPREKGHTNSGQSLEEDMDKLYGSTKEEQEPCPSSGCPSSSDSPEDSSSGQESA